MKQEMSFKDFLLNLLNQPRKSETVLEVEKDNVKEQTSKKNKLISIKKELELEEWLQKKEKFKKDFEFTQNEFFDDFGDEKSFVDFYTRENLENKNKKIVFFKKETLLEEKKNLKELNFFRFVLKKDEIYSCKLCDAVFTQHTALGGHISRLHYKKKKIKKFKTNPIEEQRKKFLKQN